jgi:hypothetical protein
MCRPRAATSVPTRIGQLAAWNFAAALALLLRHVARQHADIEAVARSSARDPLGADLGVDEDHGARALAARQQADQQRGFSSLDG